MIEMKKIAYFSAELALSQDLHIYAGGFGYVAGSHLKAAYNLGLPVVGVSIFWSEGYYDQEINPDGNSMQVVYRRRGYGDLIDTGLLLDAKIAGTDVKVRVLQVPQDTYKVCPTYLLDVDIPENNNNPLAQLITRQLYQGNADRRLAQKIILSKGIEALERLGYSIDIYHLNEGFCTVVGIELLKRELEKELNFDEALKAVRKKIVFTTHTPDQAGNEIHLIDDMYRMGCLENIPREYVIRLLNGDDKLFNTTAVLLRLAKISNGVSQLHASITQRMWSWVEGASPIAITNGIHDDLRPQGFDQIRNLEALGQYKSDGKKKMLQNIAQTTNKYLNENILTVIWARRFHEYKRPFLLFHNPEQILPLLHANKLQIVYAGKPYPQDDGMIKTWNSILQLSVQHPNLVILPGYEIELSKILKAGGDLWLNSPRRPSEACGTSGWGTLGLNLASRDGGYIEFIEDGKNGLLFGVDHEMPDYQQDKLDAESLYSRLFELVDLYYNNRQQWNEMILCAIEKVKEKFTAERMVKEYFEKMYKYEL